MTYKLSSGRRYLNGELVDPPELGPWTEADLFPLLDYDDFINAGLFDIAMDEDEWDEVEAWLVTLNASDVPLLFLIERCCDRGELLPDEMIETRLKDCSQGWISACQSAIATAPEGFVDELLSAVSLAVRVDRNRRAIAPEPETERRSTLTFFRHG